MNLSRCLCALVFGTVLAGIPMHAATPVHFGFSAQLDAPCSNLKNDTNNKLGAGASFQVTFDITPQIQLRPRLDVDVFRVSDDHWTNSDHEHYEQHNDMTAVGIGGDLLFHLNGTLDKGAYLLGGVGVLRWSQNGSTRSHWYHDESWSDYDSTRNRTSPWIALGVGYQFNHLFGLELRAVGSQYDGPISGDLTDLSSDIPTETRTAVATQLAATFRW